MASYARWRLPYSIAREAVITSTAAGRVILAGGMLPGDTSTDKVIRIDLRSGRTTRLPSLTTPVHDVAGAFYDGHPAVFGGGNATEQSVIQVLTGPSWTAATHMPTTRSDLSAVAVGGTTYIIGGYDGVNVPRTVLAVGPGGGLQRAGMLHDGVRYAATAVLGSRVYVFGGEVGNRELRGVQRFDPSTAKTSVITRLPRPLGHASAVAVGGRILLVGGRVDPSTATDAMWWFDPDTLRFTRAGRLPAATSDGAVAAFGRHVWLIGGETTQVVDRVVVLTLD